MTFVAIGLTLSLAIGQTSADAEGSNRDQSQPQPRTTASLRFEVRHAGNLARTEGGSGHIGRLLVVIGKPGQEEPRKRIGRTGLKQDPVLGCDVAAFKPGDVAVLDERSAIFPIERLDQLPPGSYTAQAVLHTNRDLNFPNAPGDFYGEPHAFQIEENGRVTVPLDLSQSLPEETLPADQRLVRYLKIRSKLLSEFHGRPIDLRAGVILPRGFDPKGSRRYPLRVHIGGLNSRFTRVGSMMSPGSAFSRDWLADRTPRMVLLHLDGAGPYGDPYQVNSDNHGPFGDAITQELIPLVESRFHCIGKGEARVLDGGSTGGWAALALQIFYPDFFNGVWASCPDSVDFRDTELINIYEHTNAFLNPHGFERPAARNLAGDVSFTVRHEIGLENVLGPGDSWTMSGGQWGAWNATYSAKGSDGRPQPLWDPRTGRIDPRVAEQWKRYDLRLHLETNWKMLGPKLRGKLHISVGESDDFFLNNAVHRFDAFLSKAEPQYEGSIDYGPGQGHCWSPLSRAELLRQMAQRVGASDD